MYFAGLLIAPAGLQRQGPVELHGAGGGTVGGAAAAVPAFLRMQEDGGLALDRIGDEHVDLAGLHAGVAADALVGIDAHRHAGSLHIGDGIHFLFHLISLFDIYGSMVYIYYDLDHLCLNNILLDYYNNKYEYYYLIYHFLLDNNYLYNVYMNKTYILLY